jgi:S1-C subfamily serine protease
MKVKVRLLGILLMAIIGSMLWSSAAALPVSAQQTGEETLDSAEINEVASKVVYIESLDRSGRAFASGSGTIVTASGLIFTNSHVVEGGRDFMIGLLEDMRELPVPSYFASLVFESRDIDFAILQIDRDENGRELDPEDLDLPHLEFNTEEVNYGEQIYILGFPDIGDGYLVLTIGNITTIENGELGNTRLPIWYRTDAEMSSGNSGGLVVNGAGEYVGIPTWVRKGDQTVGQLGGILPYPAIKAVLEEIDVNEDDIFTGGDNTVIPDLGTEVEPDAPDGDGVMVTLANDSNDTICYMYFSPTTSTEWGTDYLGSENVIEPGGEFDFEVAPAEYDMRVDDCDGNALDDAEDIVVESSTEIVYTDDGLNPGEAAQIPEDIEQSLTIEIQDIEYDAPLEGEDELGIMIYTYIRAVGYEGENLRAAMFYYWDDGEAMSGENAVEDNNTPDGALTVQTILTPEYSDTEWDGFWFWMPYSAFPDFRGSKAEAFVQAEIGVDGESFTSFSEETFFTLEE